MKAAKATKTGNGATPKDWRSDSVLYQPSLANWVGVNQSAMVAIGANVVGIELGLTGGLALTLRAPSPTMV